MGRDGSERSHSMMSMHPPMDTTDALIPDDFGGQFDEKLFAGMDPEEMFNDDVMSSVENDGWVWLDWKIYILWMFSFGLRTWLSFC